MPTAKEHVSKPVISSSDGKKLGKIKDLYFDPKVTRVAAISLGGSGILGRTRQMIEREKVEKCGIDVWLVPSANVVTSKEQIVGSQELVAASALHGRRILSEGGTEIATVDSVILDDHCMVKGFTLSKVPASGPLAQRKAVALGAITSLGNKTTPMITTLAKAEAMEVRNQDQTPTASAV